ncbi:MAG: alpha/beta hydrolase [Bryobacterales bacterium]|nr:alpha/beta hydrolase [Bryobacterales bacterium]
MARKIESLLLDGPDGKLEALLEEPEESVREAMLVCHPHPVFGGTMHNKVVYRLARALRRSGSVVLRFNFRGVGRSQGKYAEGIGELEDARAAAAWLRDRYPLLPYGLAGFSFGARIILRLGCAAADATRLVAAGVPTRHGDLDFLAHCTAPKVFVHSTRDEFGPRPDMERAVAAMAEPKELHWIEADDHFFAGSLDAFEECVYRLSGGLAAQPLHPAHGAQTN